MNNRYLRLFNCLLLFLLIQALPVKRAVADEPEEKQITSSACITVTLNDIPVGNFHSPVTFPQQPYNIEQGYNTPTEEGFWYDGVWYFGHAGMDSDGASELAGINDVQASQPGLVIYSKAFKDTKGWGEAIIYATRVNKYAEEILTFHHGHMHATESGGYSTTRRFNACEAVNKGDVIGKEGSTGFSTGSHLHFGIRRWANFETLLKAIEDGGYTLRGPGYSFDNNSTLAQNLDPGGYLFDSFIDYQLEPGQTEPPYFWSKPFALDMRHYGFEFGLWDGSFGAQHSATRREMARWLKIATERQSIKPLSATFGDVTKDDADFPYIEAMSRYPQDVPVINPDHTCTQSGHDFCPNDNINRAEALKMVILAFYSNLYLKIYNDDVWDIPANLALQNVMLFDDVSPYSWYASYVYLGTVIGLVENQQYFNPDAPVMKEEMAKWIVSSYELLHGSSNDPCALTVCQSGQFCEPDTGTCMETPACIPTETQSCDIGGGYETTPCDCSHGELRTQACGLGGTQISTCNDECQWSEWGVCTGSGDCSPGQTQPCGNCGIMTCDSNFNWGACLNQGVCASGQTQSQTCGGTGTQTRTCTSSCEWSAWSTCSVQCVCSTGICCDGCNYRSSTNQCDDWIEYRCAGTNLGDDAQYTNVTKNCSGSSSTCSGATQQSTWMTLQNCSSSQECIWSGSTPVCQDVATCTDTYSQTLSQACFDQNPNDVEICLQVNKISGANFQYRLCKTGSVFQNSISYELKDLKHPAQNPLSSGTSAAGTMCTPWKTINFSYLNEYGTTNGATLRGDILSPANTGTLYRSAANIIVYKQCL